MSWCVCPLSVKSIVSRYAAIPLGLSVAIIALAPPAKAQFADTSSTAKPSQPAQEETSSLQPYEDQRVGIIGGDIVGYELMPNKAPNTDAIAQFTPTSEPSEPGTPLPTPAS